MTAETEFAVMGTAFGNAEKKMVIRRHSTHEAAAGHALRLDMAKWDDVWVEPVAKIAGKPERPYPPPLPWTVEWVGGYAYVVDAKGNKLASLLGDQRTKEYFAGVICDIRVSL